MSILLPMPRLPQGVVIRYMDWGGDLTPPGGGSSQRLNRIGDRFAAVLTYPRLKPEPDGRIVGSAIRQAKQQGALIPVPQPGLAIGSPGSPVVNGGGQQGSTLQLRGFTPGYVIRTGQFFSIIFGGQRYLHHATADAVANGGTINLPIFPMLRIVPNDGAVCEFAQPYLEGAISGNVTEIELAIARSTPAALTIVERD